jgi:hypothetical protein
MSHLGYGETRKNNKKQHASTLKLIGSASATLNMKKQEKTKCLNVEAGKGWMSHLKQEKTI